MSKQLQVQKQIFKDLFQYFNKKMQNQTNSNKLANFYIRLRKEYEDSKPITYEVDLATNQPKTRAAKFNVMITKFISIYKWGLRESYDNEDDRKDNYWSQLNKNFHEDYEMGFVNQNYWDRPKNKIKKYFALLIHTKKIFTVLQKIVQTMGYLFINEEEKKKNFKQEITNLDFLADGKYKVMGQIITQYESYADKRRQEQKMKELQRIEEEKKKAQQLKRQKQREELQKKQRQQKERKAQQQQAKKKEVEEKMKQEARKREQESRLITSDYFPVNYEATWNENHQAKIEKSGSRRKLELPNAKEHEGKIKNSQKLFRQRFKQQLEFFSYSLKPQVNTEDKNVCFTCKSNLKQGIYSLGGNQNFCHYTGKWYCNNDISEQRMPIPWKAIEKFDLNGYSVSKTAYAELKIYYQKPIIEIKRENPIIKDNKRFYEFLVIRRQIHLIYDSICNLDLIEPLMKKRQNYCLKINLFSMKNLYDIYHGQQTSKLQRDYDILSKHFFRCEICQKRKGYICTICKDPVKIFPFQLKQTFGCTSCRKLYHRKCIPSGQCKCKQQD